MFQIKVFKNLLAAYSMIAVSAVYAEGRVENIIGYDDNPHKLGSALPSQSSDFLTTRFTLKNSDEYPIRLQLNVGDTSYLKDSRADQTSLSGKITYVQSVLNQKGNIKLSLERRDLDKTYFSRIQGDIYVRNGISVPDRFDSSQYTPRLEMEYKANTKTTVFFDLKHKQQSYDSYAELGLADLDYQQNALSLGLKHKPSPSLEKRLNVYSSKKDYDNQFARNRNGETVAGTLLKHNSFGLNASLKRDLSEQSRLYSGINYSTRQDTYEGYSDYDSFDAYVRLRRKLSSVSNFFVGAHYRRLKYDRADGLLDVEADDETPGNHAWEYSLRYSRAVFKLKNKTAYWSIGMNYYDYDSNLPAYTYHRWVTHTGLRVRF